MKKLFLTGIAVLFLATGTAHAGVDLEYGRCYTSDHIHIFCRDNFGKDWRKIIRKWRDEERLYRKRVKACHDRGEPVCADDFESPRWKGNKENK